MARVRRLLIVDDVEPILFAMGRYFSAEGYEVDTASNRAEAKRLVVAREYDVTITDLRLGGADCIEGLDLAQFIRNASPATKIVVLTAYGSPALEARAAAIGVQRFLAKPFPLSDLARLLDTLLSP